MTTGFGPAGHKARHVLADDRLAEDTPPRMLRIVPLGLRHIFFRPNSSTRASSGVIVAHLTPTPCFLMALAASMVIWSSVASRFWMPGRNISGRRPGRVDQLVLDELPDDAGHLVPVHLDDRVLGFAIFRP
jgi:hypothetical protein